MAFLFKQLFISNNNGTSNSKPSTSKSRRKSEIVTTIHDLELDDMDYDVTANQRDRRHSIPETGISTSTRDIQILDTILEVITRYVFFILI